MQGQREGRQVEGGLDRVVGGHVAEAVEAGPHTHRQPGPQSSGQPTQPRHGEALQAHLGHYDVEEGVVGQAVIPASLPHVGGEVGVDVGVAEVCKGQCWQGWAVSTITADWNFYLNHFIPLSNCTTKPLYHIETIIPFTISPKDHYTIIPFLIRS